MDRKTLLAVVISVVIIVGGMVITPLSFAAETRHGPRTGGRCAAAARGARRGGDAGPPLADRPRPPPTAKPGTAAAAAAVPGTVVPASRSRRRRSRRATRFVRETDLYTLTFAARGRNPDLGEAEEVQERRRLAVEMLLLPPAGTPSEMPFALSFGDYTAEQLAVPVHAEGNERNATRATYRLLPDIPLTDGRPLHPAQDLRVRQERVPLRAACDHPELRERLPEPELRRIRLHPHDGPADRPSLREARQQERLPQLRILGGQQAPGPGREDGSTEGAGQALHLDRRRRQVLHRHRGPRTAPLPASSSTPASSCRASTARRSPSNGLRCRARIHGHVPLLPGADEEGDPRPLQRLGEEPASASRGCTPTRWSPRPSSSGGWPP